MDKEVERGMEMHQLALAELTATRLTSRWDDKQIRDGCGVYDSLDEIVEVCCR